MPIDPEWLAAGMAAKAKHYCRHCGGVVVPGAPESMVEPLDGSVVHVECAAQHTSGDD